MTRFFTCGALAACALGVLGAAGRQQPVFRSTGDTVRVFVTVTDRDGRLVTTLGRDDFEVRDEGKPQPITLFDSTPQPIRLIVMLDVSGSMEGNLPLLREAADQLFAGLRPDDVARVGAFGREITISPSFTPRTSVPPSRGSPTSCTVSTSSASLRPNVTARCTTSTCGSPGRG